MSHKVLIVDDETNITDVCSRYLQREGYQVIAAHDGEDALALWRREQPDLLILDVMLPRKNGWELCEQIRSEQDVPIVMLTARGEEMDRLLGLTLGADDYMTKPFSPRELVLRVKAILRRYYMPGPMGGTAGSAAGEGETEEGEFIRYPGLEIDLRQRIVLVGERAVELTLKEFEVLTLLASHPGQVFSRHQILNKVWDIDYFGDTTTVTVHIRRLREKIEPVPSEPQWVKTVWGVGYKFQKGEPS
ncbi:response regulator transcription factor [Paenibacillus hodogayensis]|uniref:Response regulator transcription factor n=1 Tax=Paenibacillus hodogayensis TaxID=279208 RepID=A0ABV5VQ41_9BACL